VSTRRKRRGWGWRWLRPGLVAIIEEQDDGRLWRVFLNNRDVGCFASEGAALEFVDRLADRQGGADG